MLCFFSYKSTAALAEPWSKPVANGIKDKPEGSGACLASDAVQLSYLYPGLFFDNCLTISAEGTFSGFAAIQGEREKGNPSEIQFFTMRKEIKLQFLIFQVSYLPWGFRLNVIRTVRQTRALPWVLLESKPWGESSCIIQWDRSDL